MQGFLPSLPWPGVARTVKRRDTAADPAGCWLFDGDDLDAAIEMASRIPAARLGGTVEVRPVVER